MIDLETRLEQLAPSFGAPAWDDVERRGEALVGRRRQRRRRIALAIAVAAALFVVVPALGIPGLFDGWLTASPTEEQLPGSSIPFVYGQTLVLANGKSIELSTPLTAPLREANTKLAASSPDGRWIVYHAWEANTPNLRIVDVTNGDDRLLAEGAQSIAWRRDGALAYVQGTPHQYRPQQPWIGQVVVRGSLDASPAQWTTAAGKYQVVGWAGTRLLVESEPSLVANLQAPQGILIFSQPGRFENAGQGSVIAVSPDGHYFLARAQQGDSPSDEVRVVDARTGRIVAGLHLRSAAARIGLAPEELTNGLTSAGSWLGDRIVAVSAFTRASALVLMRFRGRELTVERALRLDGSAGLSGELGVYFSSPRFLGPTAEHVAVQAQVPRVEGGADTETSYFLTCDLVARHCLRGRPVAQGRLMALVEPPPR